MVNGSIGSETRSPSEGANIWRIIAEASAAAPPRAKWGLVLGVVVCAVSLWISAGTLSKAGGPQELYRLAGLALGIAGLLLLTLAYVLHHASQSEAHACTRVTMRMKSRVLDRIFLALPLMAVVSASLLAMGSALYIPSVLEEPLLLVIPIFFFYHVFYALKSVVHTSRFLYQHAQEQAAAAAEARAAATESQLAALQAQMNPHFLFNTLNTVASLIRTDRQAAEKTVENLAEVLRRTLDRSRTTLGTVWDELDYLKAYLAVEQERWGDRLKVEWAIDPDTLGLEIPPMILQPLVENSLKHGIGERLEGGSLRISAERENGRLSLAVSDDGIGFPARYSERTGLGNLRKRLATLYGEECDLRVENGRPGSTVVVEIPVGSGDVRDRENPDSG